MFSNLIIYRIAPLFVPELQAIEAALARTPFIECGATQERSTGWVSPRGEAHGLMAESVGGQWILRFMVESKVLPGSVLARIASAVAMKQGQRAMFRERQLLSA